MNEKEYVLWARIRDGFDAMSSEIDKFLGEKSKQVLQTYDLKKINSQIKEGAKGPYNFASQTANAANPDFNACLADLKAQDKLIRHQGFFVWRIGDDAIGFKVGKKAQKPSEPKTSTLAPATPTQLAAPVKPPEVKAQRTVEGARMLFPKDLEDMLLFTESEAYITIKPRQYLGSENFAKIASVIRDEGGEYVSAGKDSHFRLPR